MDQWIHYHLKFTFYSRTPPHYGFMENLLFESFFLMMFTSKVMPICSFTSVLSLPWLDLHGCSFLVKALQSCKHSLKKAKIFLNNVDLTHLWGIWNISNCFNNKITDCYRIVMLLWHFSFLYLAFLVLQSRGSHLRFARIWTLSL